MISLTVAELRHALSHFRDDDPVMLVTETGLAAPIVRLSEADLALTEGRTPAVLVYSTYSPPRETVERDELPD